MQLKNTQFIRALTGKAECSYEVRGGNTVGRIVPCFFRDIRLTELPVSAVLSVTALGIFEPWVNGQRVGKRWFAPGWTDYHKLVYVSEYDILPYLCKGENRFGATLGGGWFAGNISCCKKTTYGNRCPEIALLLTLTYADGHKEEIVSDELFRYAETDIRYADFYMGTMIDHRYPSPASITRPGSVLGFPAVCGDGTEAELLPDYDLSVQESERLQPVSATQHENGEWIFDFGQNFVGVTELCIKGRPGGKVTVRFGEMLYPDGRLYTENLRGAKSTDVFICRGKGEERFLPTFTFHGFRYAAVMLENAELISAEGIALTTALPQTGEFACDHALVNQLYSNIIWGMKGNFIDLPTDCPQRDERMGWLGDAQVFCRTAMYRSDCREFYRKYLRNVRDTINADGAPYELAPYVHGLEYGTAAWSDAIIVIPYQHYLFYGDKTIITENLSAMEGWIAYQLKTSSDYCRPAKGYGDWLSVRENETPKDLLGTAYFAYTSRLLSALCRKIDEYEKAEYYQKLSEKIQDSFVRHYVRADGTVVSDSQCAYLLTLGFKLVDGALAVKVAQKLKAAVLRDDSHLTCGFVGIGLLLPVLSQWGMNDLAYTILLNETYPSWGYTINNGATTIWERWNSFTKENGFGDTGMNSFNHYSLGSCGEWLTGYMCGILPDMDFPGFSELTIMPQLDPQDRICSASAKYICDRGEILSAWKTDGDQVVFRIRIPPGVKATLQYGGECYPLVCGENTRILSRENLVPDSGLCCLRKLLNL